MMKNNSVQESVAGKMDDARPGNLSFLPLLAEMQISSNQLPNSEHCPEQDCQMVCFQTKNPALSKFWKLVYL
jgi:hypothetical protein